MISENQGLEKSRSISNPGIFFSGSANLDFFFRLIVSAQFFFSGWRPGKKIKPEVSLGYEGDLDFLRARFSEIRVQIKRPIDSFAPSADK